jgi:hypothetical protein
MTYGVFPIYMECEMQLAKRDLTLLDRTRELYYKRPKYLTIDMIVEETKLAKGWLASFGAKGNKSDYGINKVQKLHDYLISKK